MNCIRPFISREVRRRPLFNRRYLSSLDGDVLRGWTGSSNASVATVGTGTIGLSHDDKSGVTVLSLNRVPKMNAINMTMFEDMEKAFGWIAARRNEVRCVILKGDGENFCAGIDLNVLLEINNLVASKKCPSHQREIIAQIVSRLQRITSLPENCHAPVIAASEGVCFGAGVDLVTACDFRLCTSSTTYCVKETDLAIVADLGTLQRLPLIVGEQRARELVYTSRKVSGTEAKEIGLVLECFKDSSELLNGAHELAGRIAGKSSITIRGAKKCMNRNRQHLVTDGLEYVRRWNAAHLLSADLKKAMDSRPGHQKK